MVKAMTPPPPDKIENAAGCIVCRTSGSGQLEALVVMGRLDMPAYVGFPKGKSFPAEPLEATAIRETREETGTSVGLLALAAISRYQYVSPKGRLVDKTVHFYLAAPIETGGPRDAEYASVGWLPVEEVAERLTYDADREALQTALRLLADNPLYRQILADSTSKPD